MPPSVESAVDDVRAAGSSSLLVPEIASMHRTGPVPWTTRVRAALLIATKRARKNDEVDRATPTLHIHNTVSRQSPRANLPRQRAMQSPTRAAKIFDGEPSRKSSRGRSDELFRFPVPVERSIPPSALAGMKLFSSVHPTPLERVPMTGQERMNLATAQSSPVDRCRCPSSVRPPPLVLRYHSANR